MSEYQKPSQEEMMQARYAGDGRPNYEETQRTPDNFVAGDRSQPYYMYHKDRYSEYRR
jgi:hypothetical protein